MLLIFAHYPPFLRRQRVSNVNYEYKDIICAWLTSFSILLRASNKVLSLENKCWRFKKGFFFCLHCYISPHNLLSIWNMYQKTEWFDRSGLWSSSLCFKPLRRFTVPSSDFWNFFRSNYWGTEWVKIPDADWRQIIWVCNQAKPRLH